MTNDHHLFASFIEWRRHDFSSDAAATHIPFEAPASGGVLDGEISEADVFLEVWRGAARTDVAHLLAINEDRVAIARDAAFNHFKADQLARQTLLFLRGEHIASDEIA